MNKEMGRVLIRRGGETIAAGEQDFPPLPFSPRCFGSTMGKRMTYELTSSYSGIVLSIDA